MYLWQCVIVFNTKYQEVFNKNHEDFNICVDHKLSSHLLAKNKHCYKDFWTLEFFMIGMLESTRGAGANLWSHIEPKTVSKIGRFFSKLCKKFLYPNKELWCSLNFSCLSILQRWPDKNIPLATFAKMLPKIIQWKQFPNWKRTTLYDAFRHKKME